MNRSTPAFFAALILAAALASGPSMAASTDVSTMPSGNYNVDKSHARITFHINHLGFSVYTARFNDFDAHINFDAKEPEKSVVEATVNVASVDAHNDKLETHLRSADFFNTDKFPTATFKSIKTTRSGNTGTMIGNLTLMGVTKPITLSVTFHGGGEHPMMKVPVLGFGAKTTIQRSQWGINFGIPNVGDEVTIEIDGEFDKGDVPAATAAAPVTAPEPAKIQPVGELKPIATPPAVTPPAAPVAPAVPAPAPAAPAASKDSTNGAKP